MCVFPLEINGSEVTSKIMVEPPRSFRRGNSDHEKRETDTGVLCAFQSFKYSDSRSVLQNIIIAVIQLIYLIREITFSSMKTIVFEIVRIRKHFLQTMKIQR